MHPPMSTKNETITQSKTDTTTNYNEEEVKQWVNQSLFSDESKKLQMRLKVLNAFRDKNTPKNCLLAMLKLLIVYGNSQAMLRMIELTYENRLTKADLLVLIEHAETSEYNIKNQYITGMSVYQWAQNNGYIDNLTYIYRLSDVSRNKSSTSTGPSHFMTDRAGYTPIPEPEVKEKPEHEQDPQDELEVKEQGRSHRTDNEFMGVEVSISPDYSPEYNSQDKFEFEYSEMKTTISRQDNDKAIDWQAFASALQTRNPYKLMKQKFGHIQSIKLRADIDNLLIFTLEADLLFSTPVDRTLNGLQLSHARKQETYQAIFKLFKMLFTKYKIPCTLELNRSGLYIHGNDASSFKELRQAFCATPNKITWIKRDNFVPIFLNEAMLRDQKHKNQQEDNENPRVEESSEPHAQLSNDKKASATDPFPEPSMSTSVDGGNTLDFEEAAYPGSHQDAIANERIHRGRVDSSRYSVMQTDGWGNRIPSIGTNQAEFESPLARRRFVAPTRGTFPRSRRVDDLRKEASLEKENPQPSNRGRGFASN